ncbi:MAG: hypothetical protein HC910_10550 [Spirulinaceae cyanobacterium SM2_1_0]|nr:hypothetical protein [Spirulinaceae cyanobacterium SM2_1_0]
MTESNRKLEANAPARMPLPAEERCFAIILTGLIGLLGAIGLSQHAMWRDELNAWLVATESHSWAQLVANVQYEGHPLLWYLSLAAVQRLWADPRAMQVLHLALALGSVWLLARYAPFLRWQRLLLVFGYLPFYEYLLISRNYAWGLLSLLLFCTLWPTRRRTYLGVAIALVLAANSNAYCFLIAVTLGSTLILDARLGTRARASRLDCWGSFFLVLIGLAIALATILPPADSQLQGGFSTSWILYFDLRHFLTALTRVWSSYIVILIPSDSKYFDVVLFAIFSLLLLAGAIARLRRQPAILGFYLSSTLAILGLTYAKFLGSPRHFGHLFIVLLVALWLSHDSPTTQHAAPVRPSSKFKGKILKLPDFIGSSRRRARLWRRVQATGFAIILLGQTLGGLVAFSRDLVVPYSAGRATAEFIRRQGWAADFIVGSQDMAMATLAGYLDREIYYPEIQALGSFVLFTGDRQPLPMQSIFEQLQDLLHAQESILLILNYELRAEHRELAIAPLAAFTDSLIFNEKYFLYRVSTKPRAARPD